MPLAEKIAVADYVIDNAGELEETRHHVVAVWRDILAGGPRRYRHRESQREPMSNAEPDVTLITGFPPSPRSG